jgi:hypothetical protein
LRSSRRICDLDSDGRSDLFQTSTVGGLDWFALSEVRPLFAFAGIWTEFKGDRGTKSTRIPGPRLVSCFLTTAPNAVVEPIHPKAMAGDLAGPTNAGLGSVCLGSHHETIMQTR